MGGFDEYTRALTPFDPAKHRVTAIGGASRFLAARALEQVRRRLVEGGWEITSGEGGEHSPQQWQDWIAAPSLFRSRAAYIIRRAKADLLPLAHDWAQRPGGAPVVIEWQPWPRGKGKKAPPGHRVPCAELRPYEVPQLVREEMKELAFPLTGDATGQLVEASGQDAARAINELRKLSLIFGTPQKKPLTATMIAPYLGAAGEDVAFRLAGLLRRQEFPAAGQMISELLASGTPPLSLLGLIARHCRLVLARGDDKLARALGFSPAQLKGYNRVGAPQLAGCRQVLRLCQGTDDALKGQPLPPDLLLHDVVAALGRIPSVHRP